MLDIEQVRLQIVRPTLNLLDLGGKAAEELVLGTALTESNLTYLKQVGAGPALGLWQMEPKTHDDIWLNFLPYKAELRAKIILLTRIGNRVQQLVGNLEYACALARVHYYRVAEPLPVAGDLNGQANYWKKYYNTVGGAGSPEHFINAAKPLHK